MAANQTCVSPLLTAPSGGELPLNFAATRELTTKMRPSLMGLREVNGVLHLDDDDDNEEEQPQVCVSATTANARTCFKPFLGILISLSLP